MVQGLSSTEAKRLQIRYGLNTFDTGGHGNKALWALLARFRNPLVIILLVAATLSLFFGDKASFFIIIVIVLLSVTLDFFNSYRSDRAAEALKDKVRVKATVVRDGKETLLAVSQLVPGDIVRLNAGKIIPADGVIVDSNSLYCNESSLTGESFPQAKPINANVYMGSAVMSGTGTMRVMAVGQGTKFAHIVQNLQSKHIVTEFEREIRDFSSLIIRITFVLVLFVFAVNGLAHHNLLESLLFSLALAVGLTPELLPLIITLNLTRGSLKMAKNGVIVKQLSAIQNFGSMDMLCTDKTGTLTEDRIVLVKYIDGLGEVSDRVLELGYLASVFSTGFDNPLDQAVRRFKGGSEHGYEKIDEIPFDFKRRREAVIVHHKTKGERLLIVKGAPETIIDISTSYLKSGQKLDARLKQKVTKTYDRLSQSGFRVLAVGYKKIEAEKSYETNDETRLCFMGYLAFLDPAKKDVADTLGLLKRLGINIKIVTGDNAEISAKIAGDIGLNIEGIKTGEQISSLSDKRLAATVEHTTIFARVDPDQKLRIIKALQANKHVVGYMGDGVNDAPSIRAADVGISVNNAVDVAKDSADFILLQKSLHELAGGVVDGRRTFANTYKYLRMSLSSNFGNMISMAGASLFLPFLPMLATQILLNNLLYDSSQFTIPLDNVDEDEVFKPHRLDIATLKSFMWHYGLLSSVFDFITFGLLLLVFKADQSLFQTGWFIESFLTQVLVIYVIRTYHNATKHSRPSWPLILATVLTICVAFIIILLPIRRLFHFSSLSLYQISVLLMVVLAYLASAELLKYWLYRSET